MRKSKVFPTFAEAVRDIPDGSVIGFGGFAVVGMPINLYAALTEQGAKGLTCVSNGTRGGATMPEHAPTMEWLIRNDQVTKAICSFTAPTRAVSCSRIRFPYRWPDRTALAGGERRRGRRGDRGRAD